MEWLISLWSETSELGGIGQLILVIVVLFFGTKWLTREKIMSHGLIGAVARAWKNIKENAIEEDQAANLHKISQLEEVIKQLKESNMRDEARLKAELDEIIHRENHYHAYILYVVQEVRRVRIWAKENDYELPIPPIMTYNEWLKTVDML